MKDNRGFTLIEVLGVVVIIAAISLLAFPPIIEQIRKSHSSISESTLQLIYTGTDLYMYSDKSSYLNRDGAIYCISLRSIVDKGFLNDPITDTMNNKNMDLDQNVVKAVYEGNTFSYTLVSDGSCVQKNPAMTFEEIMSESDQVAALDPGSNPRYVGTDPDNYVWFNEELWRIIGLFDGQIKLLKDGYYSNSMAWDSNGTSDWTNASLKDELNGVYLSSIQANDSTSYSYIDLNYVWYICSTNTYSLPRDYVYFDERCRDWDGSVLNSFVTWEGAIGLMYASDYGYSVVEYDDDIINSPEEVSWFSLLENNVNQWTLNSTSYEDGSVFELYSDGYISWLDGGLLEPVLPNSHLNSAVRPALYLKSDVGVVDGTGDREDPFILGLIN